MMVLDVKRAHFHAAATRRLFIELPPEDAMAGNPDVCGELVMSMYGTRDAAYNWEASYAAYLETLGFKRGRASACHFFNSERGIRLLVHGDDFVAIGAENDLQQWAEQMRSKQNLCHLVESCTIRQYDVGS